MSRKQLAGYSVVLLALGGCFQTGNIDVSSNFDTVTLKPGDSALCVQSPCTVYFTMPEGAGSTIVSGLDVFPESYPLGKTVFLGSFWTGSYSMQAEGTDTPFAYLTVAGGGEADGDLGIDGIAARFCNLGAGIRSQPRGGGDPYAHGPAPVGVRGGW